MWRYIGQENLPSSAKRSVICRVGELYSATFYLTLPRKPDRGRTLQTAETSNPLGLKDLCLRVMEDLPVTGLRIVRRRGAGCCQMTFINPAGPVTEIQPQPILPPTLAIEGKAIEHLAEQLLRQGHVAIHYHHTRGRS